MKNQLQSALLAVAVTAGAFSSSAATYNSDLLIGFTVQSGNDLVYDLGSAASLVDGKTWDLSSLLGTLNNSSVKWGVIGDSLGAAPHTVWATKPAGTPTTLNGNAAWSAINSPTVAMYGLFPTAGAGQSMTPSSSLANSWNQQTITASGTTPYHVAYMNPNTSGYTAVNFWGTVTDNSSPQLLGTFSFANTGTVTFNTQVVPEPSTNALFAGAGLLAFSLRNKLRRKQA